MAIDERQAPESRRVGRKGVGKEGEFWGDLIEDFSRPKSWQFSQGKPYVLALTSEHEPCLLTW